MGLASNDHNQFPAELRVRGDSLNGSSRGMQREDTMRNDARAQTKRHQVHNKVEAVGVHRGFELQAVSFQPGAQPLASVRLLTDEQPALTADDVGQMGWRNLTRKPGELQSGRHDDNEFVRESMRDMKTARELRRRGNDSGIQLSAFHRSENESAGLVRDVQLHSRKFPLKAPEESWQV